MSIKDGTVNCTRHGRTSKVYWRKPQKGRPKGTLLCADCAVLYTRKFRKQYPEKVAASYNKWKAANRAEYLRRRRIGMIREKYGMTAEEYDARVVAQDGKCAACRRPPSGVRPYLFIDHCHKSGRVRGLLCHECNLMVGWSRDNPDTLRAAAEYLCHS